MECFNNNCRHNDETMTDNCAKGEPPDVESCAQRAGKSPYGGTPKHESREDAQCSVERLAMPRKFVMDIEPHIPKNTNNPCGECVLSHGWMCLDRSYCEFPKTGKTWKKKG